MLNLKNEQFCNGAIIDDKTIVTTAHCVIDTKGYPLQSRIGFTVTAGNKERQVEKLIHLKDPSKTNYNLVGPNLVVIKVKIKIHTKQLTCKN